jgi:uncharacterized protein YkwD
MPALKPSGARVCTFLIAASVLVAPALAGAARPHTSTTTTGKAKSKRTGYRSGHTRSYLPRPRPPARLDVPCLHARSAPNEATADELARAVLCLVNQERARHRLGALPSRPILRRVAQQHARDMVSRDYFAHSTPDGRSYRDRIRLAGYYRKPAIRFLAGENIAWVAGASGTPQAVVSTWMRSRAHRAEVLRRRFRHAGVGVVRDLPERLQIAALAGATYAIEFGALGYPSARLAALKR